MSYGHFIVATAVVCLYNVALSTATSSNCEKAKSGNHQYTWNFVFPGGNGIQAKTLADMNILKTNNTVLGHHAGGASTDSHETQTCPECPKNEPGVYWRQWTGKIPQDAIVGGHFAKDSGPVPIYLAQAYLPHKGFAGLQPGQLFNDSTSMTAVFSGVHAISSNVKILCGFQGDVVWIPFAQTTGLSPSTDFVNAGFERTLDLYFARSVYGGKQLIGKLILQHKLMYLPYAGKESALRNFEVLCYRKSVMEKKIEIPHPETI